QLSQVKLAGRLALPLLSFDRRRRASGTGGNNLFFILVVIPVCEPRAAEQLREGFVSRQLANGTTGFQVFDQPRKIQYLQVASLRKRLQSRAQRLCGNFRMHPHGSACILRKRQTTERKKDCSSYHYSTHERPLTPQEFCCIGHLAGPF